MAVQVLVWNEDLMKSYNMMHVLFLPAISSLKDLKRRNSLYFLLLIALLPSLKKQKLHILLYCSVPNLNLLPFWPGKHFFLLQDHCYESRNPVFFWYCFNDVAVHIHPKSATAQPHTHSILHFAIYSVDLIISMEEPSSSARFSRVCVFVGG